MYVRISARSPFFNTLFTSSSFSRCGCGIYVSLLSRDPTITALSCPPEGSNTGQLPNARAQWQLTMQLHHPAALCYVSVWGLACSNKRMTAALPRVAAHIRALMPRMLAMSMLPGQRCHKSGKFLSIVQARNSRAALCSSIARISAAFGSLETDTQPCNLLSIILGLP